MLQIKVPGREFFDERTQTFYETKPCILKLEHSLLSISKWEAKWHKPFLTPLEDKPISRNEMMDYIICMSLSTNIEKEVILSLSNKDIDKITEYIQNPMTATTFVDRHKSQKREIITSEIVYYWMVMYNIPFECEKWHINRLLTLIRVCTVKMNAEKMSKNDLYAQNRAINMARRKRLGTKG